MNPLAHPFRTAAALLLVLVGAGAWAAGPLSPLLPYGSGYENRHRLIPPAGDEQSLPPQLPADAL
ncbi:MAG: hypothetical protein KDF54_04955, partial [Hydrogenophaga sp.]|nr:hypothetical protein [Hydrogenophaga sp.]